MKSTTDCYYPVIWYYKRFQEPPRQKSQGFRNYWMIGWNMSQSITKSHFQGLTLNRQGECIYAILIKSLDWKLTKQRIGQQRFPVASLKLFPCILIQKMKVCERDKILQIDIRPLWNKTLQLQLKSMPLNRRLQKNTDLTKQYTKSPCSW